MTPLLALIATVALAQEPVRVGATLSAPSVRVNEATVLEITVVTSGGTIPDSIGVPVLPPTLETVSSADFQETQISIPGGRRQVFRRQLGLVSRTPGRFEIAPVSVWVRGRRWNTPALVLNVSGSAAAAGGTRGPEDEVVLQAFASPDTVFVGEQVTLRVDALFSEDVRSRLRSAPEYQPPNPVGFWVYDLPNPIAVDFRRVQNEFYEVQTFRRAYFPLSPGTFVLPPAKLLYDVREGFLNSPQTRELSSAPLRIVVRPLPLEGRPAAFKGAVGRYLARARLEPLQVPAGEAATLTVEVEGQGNLKSLPPPTLPEISGVQVYPPSEESSTTISDGTVRGSKTFSWVLIPERPGRLTLPSVEYAFFDPARRAYSVTRTASLFLEVSPGGTISDAPPVATLRPAATAPSDLEGMHWVRTRGFAALQLLPLLGVLAALWRRRVRDRPRQTPARDLRARLDTELERLRREELDAPGGHFFAHLGSAFRVWLAARFRDEAFQRTSIDVIAKRLTETGIEPQVAEETAEYVRTVDHARYSPDPPGRDARRDFLRSASTLADRLDPATATRASASTSAVLLLLLLGAALLPLPMRAQERAASAVFGEGLSAYDAGAFRESARRFTNYVRAHPEDPNGWYNLGNAWYRSGEQGRAIWAWLRALRVQPRNPGARYNLRLAGIDDAVLMRVLPPLRMTEEEILLASSGAWFLAGCALAFYVLRKRRGAAFIAVVSGLLALVLLLAIGLERIRASTGIAFGATSLLGAPAFRAERLRVIQDGEPLTLVQRQGDWFRVTTTDGAEGWVQRSHVGSL